VRAELTKALEAARANHLPEEIIDEAQTLLESLDRSPEELLAALEKEKKGLVRSGMSEEEAEAEVATRRRVIEELQAERDGAAA
jgi:DNA mismatch repair ATPase MutS